MAELVGDLLQLYLSRSGQHIVVTSLNPQVIGPHTIGLRGDYHSVLSTLTSEAGA